MSRKSAREMALRFLYLLDFQAEDRPRQEALFLESDTLPEGVMEGEDKAYFDRVVDGVLAKRQALDETIKPFLVDWRFERLPILDQNIVRLALYEMDYCPDTPAAVAIAEAVRLAKLYSDDKARSYINAVLASLAKREEQT